MQNVLGSFGRSRARRYQPSGDQVTFEDVAGVDEAEAELVEIVDFLRDPEKYQRLGGSIPAACCSSAARHRQDPAGARGRRRGECAVLLDGGAEFVEMVVGVGAARVRELFAEANKAAPAIVFIDELDAIGRRASGGAGFSGGNDEREQTLNQLLTEMDGFDSSTGVIVLAATNRPDVLDPALLRPGRFDRRVTVQPPDRAGPRGDPRGTHTRRAAGPRRRSGHRRDHTGNGRRRPANLVNEAALLAAREDMARDGRGDFTEALEKIALGAERKLMMDPEERRRVAYHEAGHAIVGMLTEGADPVRKISIIPRGVALGVTFAAPEADRFNYQEQELLARSRSRSGAAPPRRSCSASRPPAPSRTSSS